MTLDQILTDDDYQECSRLCSTSGMSELQEVTDVKGLSPLYILSI